jgi:DNA modification methylase
MILEVVMYLLVRGDARRLPIADGSVHCVVTSPPYWGLRSYLDSDDPLKAHELGSEPTPDEFVAVMVGVFREVWRVLHPSGTVWLNMGDSYNSVTGGGNGVGLDGKTRGGALQLGRVDRTVKNLKPKDLCMIPARLALALQADGWYLRSEIIWAKPNPMPESVTDRPTKSHEQVYLLSKQERYYFDAEAVREDAANSTLRRASKGYLHGGCKSAPERNDLERFTRPFETARNLRSVWTIATESFPGAHFATFPRALVSPCIRAGTSERGCCPRCGAPWARKTEGVSECRQTGNGWQEGRAKAGHHGPSRPGSFFGKRETIGWSPSCSCAPAEVPLGELKQWLPVPCTVLDPFCGAATTLVVAEALGRRGIGVELSAEYLAIARRRLEHPHAATPRPGRVEAYPLFGDAPCE